MKVPSNHFKIAASFYRLKFKEPKCQIVAGSIGGVSSAIFVMLGIVGIALRAVIMKDTESGLFYTSIGVCEGASVSFLAFSYLNVRLTIAALQARKKEEFASTLKHVDVVAPADEESSGEDVETSEEGLSNAETTTTNNPNITSSKQKMQEEDENKESNLNVKNVDDSLKVTSLKRTQPRTKGRSRSFSCEPSKTHLIIPKEYENFIPQLPAQPTIEHQISNPFEMDSSGELKKSLTLIIDDESLDSSIVEITPDSVDRGEGTSSGGPGILTKAWSAVSSCLEKISSTVREFFALEGGELQKKNYIHLLTPYLDTILRFHKIDPDSIATTHEKICQIKNCFMGENFSFIYHSENDQAVQSEFKRAYSDFVWQLLSLDNLEISPMARRYFVMLAINKIIETDEYRQTVDKIINDEQDQIDEALLCQVQLVLEILKTAWTKVSINSYAQEIVPKVLKDGYYKLNWGKNTNKYLEERGNLTEEELFKPINWPSSLCEASPITLAHMIACDFKAIGESSETGSQLFATLNSLRGHFNFGFWPLMVNNFTSSLFTVDYYKDQDNFQTQCLRFGTPTLEYSGTPEIMSFFLGFLDVLSIEGKRLISFQHQNPKPKSSLKGNENKRLQLMFNIPKRDGGKYRDVYIPFGLAMDGDWYDQTGIYDDDTWDVFNFFLEEYLELLMEQKQDKKLGAPPYYIDWHQLEEILNVEMSDLKGTIKVEIKNLLTQLRDLYFEGKETLSSSERRIFLTISYPFIEEYFVLLLKGDYFHSQCKDAQDRAMTIIALMHWRNLVRTGKICDPIEVQNFRALTHFAALLIKGTPMHGAKKEQVHGRAQRFLEVLHHLELQLLNNPGANFGSDDKVVVVMGEEWNFLDTNMITTQNQTYYPIPSEATTKQQYDTALIRENALSLKLDLQNYLLNYEEERENVNFTIDGNPIDEFDDPIYPNLSRGFASDILNFTGKMLHQRYGHEQLGYKVQLLDDEHHPIQIDYCRASSSVTVRAHYLLNDLDQVMRKFISATMTLHLNSSCAKIKWLPPTDQIIDSTHLMNSFNKLSSHSLEDSFLKI